MIRAVKTFGRWYWRRVKEIPLVVGAFTAGCLFEAAAITFPQIAYAVLS